MTLYVCFARGMADFMPASQDYRRFDSPLEFAHALNHEITTMRNECGPVYRYLVPSHALSTWDRGAQGSFRAAIAKDFDEVLDVIAMTQADWEREANGGEE